MPLLGHSPVDVQLAQRTYTFRRLTWQEEVVVYRRVVAESILLEQEKIPHAYAVQEIEAACQRHCRARRA